MSQCDNYCMSFYMGVCTCPTSEELVMERPSRAIPEEEFQRVVEEIMERFQYHNGFSIPPSWVSNLRDEILVILRTLEKKP